MSKEEILRLYNSPTFKALKEAYKNNLSIAANGCMYEKNKQGFLPALMEKMYNDRILYKNEMIKSKKLIELIKSEIKSREAA